MFNTAKWSRLALRHRSPAALLQLTLRAQDPATECVWAVTSLHVLVVMDGARMARVTRGHDGELMVNFQCNGNSKQQQQQQQRNADGRTAKQQRSFECSERHRARIAAAAADRTEPVNPKDDR